MGRSVDGFTAGFPTAVALDGRTALVAYAMNGEPLPADHGHPARLIVSGLYGYVSATKWLEEIELTTWESFDGYWVPRGWSKVGPIKLQSRIDVPRADASLVAGAQPIAGVAWAPDTGVERVEVQVDDGPWRTARLGCDRAAPTPGCSGSSTGTPTPAITRSGSGPPTSPDRPRRPRSPNLHPTAPPDGTPAASGSPDAVAPPTHQPTTPTHQEFP